MRLRPSGNPADILNYLPSAAEIDAGASPFAFAKYNRANKLPYTINTTLDIQWQPRNDLAIQVGYVGSLGRHLVIPIPFNQVQIASPSHPIHGQYYTYGYTVLDSNDNPIALPLRPNGTSVGHYLEPNEGRKYRPARTLCWLFFRMRERHGCGNQRLQRFGNACREASEPRFSSRLFLHLVARHR